MTAPVALVLDDVHLLHNSACRAALSVLADRVPAGSRLALAGRDEPPLRVARLRAEGRITEIGAGDLALTRAEAALLLRDAEVTLDDGDVAELQQRTEGGRPGCTSRRCTCGKAASCRCGQLVQRWRSAGERICGGGAPGPDLPTSAGVLDPDGGAGSDVWTAV